MGGNALTQIKTVRKNATEYKTITNHILITLQPYCDFLGLIPSYADKNDFGDADFLVVFKNNVKDIKQLLNTLFTPTQIVKNDTCYSFDYAMFQIDIICSTQELYKASFAYYSYNDLGNLIGRIAYNHNLKYGHKGLYLRLDDHEKSELLISRDTAKSLKFLGFNPDTFFNGFKTKEDIFNYVINSNYFNKDYFSLKNLNHINRTRNRKRKTYMEFLEYIKQHSKKLKNKDYKIITLEDVVAYFPESNIIEKINVIKNQQQQQKELSLKFNGEIVKQITNLKDKQLGEFIKKFKNFKTNFNEWLRTVDSKTISTEIITYYNLWLKDF